MAHLGYYPSHTYNLASNPLVSKKGSININTWNNPSQFKEINTTQQ
jgi:hypothetical protein